MLMRRPIRRFGRPGLLGTMARTAVVAGTATAVVGGVQRHQQSRATEAAGSITGYPKFTRQTLVERVGGGPTDLVDYKIITVLVSTPALKIPVKKTTIISDF